MDIVTYKLSQKYADKVAAGFSSVRVDGLNIIFTLNDGKTATVAVPAPKDGVSITNVSLNQQNHLICTLSDGTAIDAGLVPQGVDGRDAKINGVNTLTIEAGDNITLDQEGNILTINSTGGGSGGTSNYNALTNKPKINNVELRGNKSLNDLGIQPEITSQNKLASGLVDDSNQTNKFVTENEKTAWNTEIENLHEEDELLKRNLQTTTGLGEEVTLEKTTELDFVKPPLPRGNTKQNTTTGKNLLPPFDSGSLNDLTFTTNSNGITTISGTTTSVTTYFKNVNKILPAGTYTLSINLSYTPPANSSQLILQDINNVRLATINLWKITSKTFTLSADTEIKNYYLFSNSEIQHNGTISIQLEEGPTATSYEPYTGGIPSPNPSYPQEVEVVTGNVEVTISNENNTESKTLPVSLGNIELCKIGDYQDYLYKDSGKWYVHKNIIKIDLSTITSYTHTSGWRNPTSFVADNVFYHEYSGYTTVASLFCNRLIADTPARITGSVINAIGLGRNSSIYLSVEGITTSNALITYFSQNPTYLYAPLETPTDTEITDTTLISQLEEISKTLSYQGQTNITSNTIALFDVEAYQDLKIILTNYVTFNDYATSSKGGVVKVDGAFSTFMTDGKLKCTSKTYEDYQNLSLYAFIGKGTLENVITGKNLETSNNKVTSISSSSTNTEYPSAKAVYDYIQSLNGDEVNY